MYCPYEDCKSILLVPTRDKGELLRLAEAGDLVLICPYHDRVKLPIQQQVEFASKWNPPPEP
jgi:hypothetical protein